MLSIVEATAIIPTAARLDSGVRPTPKTAMPVTTANDTTFKAETPGKKYAKTAVRVIDAI